MGQYLDIARSVQSKADSPNVCSAIPACTSTANHTASEISEICELSPAKTDPEARRYFLWRSSEVPTVKAGEKQ